MAPDLSYFSKLILLNISIYLLAKLIPEQDLLEKYLRIIYYIACIASIQGALTIAADIGEFYYIGETVIRGIGGSGDIILPFWGLIGAHVFMRAFWYFSESAYFAQFLMIALGYAIATRRHLGIPLLTIGILSTFAVGSMIATLIILLAVTLSSRGKLATPVATVFATVFICYLLVGNIYLNRSSEGMTTTVLSAPLIEDIKARKLEIESYTDQIKTLQENPDYHHLTPQQKYEVEIHIKTLQSKIDISLANMLGNLRGHDSDKILNLSSKKVTPNSQIVPSDNALERTPSINSKIGSLVTAWEFFLQNPFGGGMMNPNKIIPDLITAAGWVGLTLTFGCFWLLVLAPIYAFLAKRILLAPYDCLVTTMCITLAGIFLSTFFHGPHLKFEILFILSLLVSAVHPHSKNGR